MTTTEDSLGPQPVTCSSSFTSVDKVVYAYELRMARLDKIQQKERDSMTGRKLTDVCPQRHFDANTNISVVMFTFLVSLVRCNIFLNSSCYTLNLNLI